MVVGACVSTVSTATSPQSRLGSRTVGDRRRRRRRASRRSMSVSSTIAPFSLFAAEMIFLGDRPLVRTKEIINIFESTPNQMKFLKAISKMHKNWIYFFQKISITFREIFCSLQNIKAFF